MGMVNVYLIVSLGVEKKTRMLLQVKLLLNIQGSFFPIIKLLDILLNLQIV